MEYRQNELFKHRKPEEIPSHNGWGYSENGARRRFDMLNDKVIRSQMFGIDQLPGFPNVEESKSNATKDLLKFQKLDPEVGSQLIGPLKGRCFSDYEDVWEYKYCIG